MGLHPLLKIGFVVAPGAGFIPIISTKVINQIKKNFKKKVMFYAYEKISDFI